jgi:hypothetical protein
MVQGCEHFRFTLESTRAVGVADGRVWEDLERDVAIESRIAGAIHLAHAADQADDFIGA